MHSTEVFIENRSLQSFAQLSQSLHQRRVADKLFVKAKFMRKRLPERGKRALRLPNEHVFRQNTRALATSPGKTRRQSIAISTAPIVASLART
jgi:hypothetical protein